MTTLALRLMALSIVLAHWGCAKAHAETVLPIDPVYQQTPVWCWAAVGEMVFSYYGVHNINPAGNFQCGIIALVHPVCDQNCASCQIPAGSLNTMNNMLTQYPRFASRVSGSQTRLRTTVSRRALFLEGVQNEIDEGRPVVAGISPSGYRSAGVSEHVALIVGYDDDVIIVNDPFPFSSMFSRDPYLAAGGEEVDRGQYRISYSRFRSDLQWQETIYRVECEGSGCNAAHSTADSADDSDDRESRADRYEDRDEPVRTVAMGRSCATPLTRCGPFFDQPALPLGSTCHCNTPYGPSVGRVVR